MDYFCLLVSHSSATCCRTSCRTSCSRAEHVQPLLPPFTLASRHTWRHILHFEVCTAAFLSAAPSRWQHWTLLGQSVQKSPVLARPLRQALPLPAETAGLPRLPTMFPAPFPTQFPRCFRCAPRAPNSGAHTLPSVPFLLHRLHESGAHPVAPQLPGKAWQGLRAPPVALAVQERGSWTLQVPQ